MKRNVVAAVVIVGLAALIFGTLYKLHLPPFFPAAPEPCVVRKFFGTSIPKNFCHDQGKGNCAGNLTDPKIMDGNTGVYACCPVGFDPQSNDKGITVFCVKKP